MRTPWNLVSLKQCTAINRKYAFTINLDLTAQGGSRESNLILKVASDTYLTKNNFPLNPSSVNDLRLNEKFATFQNFRGKAVKSISTLPILRVQCCTPSTDFFPANNVGSLDCFSHRMRASQPVIRFFICCLANVATKSVNRGLLIFVRRPRSIFSLSLNDAY